MNELIKELHREAEKSVAFLSNSKESKQLIIREKFAELIIRKCCSIADDWVNNYDDGKNYPSERIKQHFGVKE